MDRSLYPEGVEVHQRDLERTENTKSFHIIQRHEDTAELGVVSGSVTVSTTDGTTIDISSVSGYVPNGEFVESIAVQGLQLADYTLGVVNYAVCIYRENNVNPQPHETTGDSQPTSAERSSEIKVLSETEYNNLPITDENLNNDSLDRTLILAKVTGRGVGVNLTVGDIIGPTTFTSAITISSTSNITGMEILSVDSTTNTGDGILSFLFGTQEFTWQAPNDPSPGSPVGVTVSGTYVVSSSSGKILTLQVIVSLLPGSNQTDTVTITNIYSQNVSRHTSTDFHHRSLIGSGIPSVSNPHGLTIEDLSRSTGGIEAHQDLFHSNGILRISDPNVLLATVNAVPIPDILTVVAPTDLDLIYLNGINHSQIDNINVTFTDVVDDAQAIFDIYISEGIGGIATLEKRERIRYTTTPPPLLSGVVQIIDISKEISGGSAARIFFDDSESELIFDSGTGTFGSAESVPTTGAATIRLYDENKEFYLDVYVNDISNWGGIDGGGDIFEDFTVTSLPTDEQLEEKLRIAAVTFSGATGFLGYGFGAANSPNNILDRRFFGITGFDDLRDDVAKWKVLPSTPTPSPEALMYTGRIGVSDIDSFNHPLRAIHIYDDNGLAEQVWESGTVNFDDVGRIWRLGTDSSGNFEITRSKSSLRDTEVSIHLDASGRMGIHTIPDTALHVVSLSGQTAIKAEAIDNGIGIESVGGPNSGHGGTFRALANDDHGAIGYGHGTGTGIVGVGGNDSGIGIHGIGGTGNSTGVLGEGVGDGKGIHGIGGGDQAGVYGVGGDTGIGGEFFGGSTSGYGIYGDSVERGVYGKGLGAGTGGYFDGGATNGVGMIAIGGGSARGAEITGGALVGGDLDMNVVNDEVRCNSYRWHAAASRTFTIWVGHPQATFLRTHDLTTSVVSEVTDTEARWSGTSAENYVIAPFIWPNHYILTAWTAYIGVAGASSVTVQLMRKLMSSVSSQIIGTPQTSAVSAGQITLGQTGLSIGRIDTFTYFLKCFHATGAGTSHFKGLELVFSCSEPPIEGWSL